MKNEKGYISQEFSTDFLEDKPSSLKIMICDNVYKKQPISIISIENGIETAHSLTEKQFEDLVATGIEILSQYKENGDSY